MYLLGYSQKDKGKCFTLNTEKNFTLNSVDMLTISKYNQHFSIVNIEFLAQSGQIKQLGFYSLWMRC